MSSSSFLDYSVEGAMELTIVVLVLSTVSLVLRFWSRIVAPGLSLGFGTYLNAIDAFAKSWLA